MTDEPKLGLDAAITRILNNVNKWPVGFESRDPVDPAAVMVLLAAYDTQVAAMDKVRVTLYEVLGAGHCLKAFAGTMLRWGEPGVDVSDEARRVVTHAEDWHKRVCEALNLLEGTK